MRCRASAGDSRPASPTTSRRTTPPCAAAAPRATRRSARRARSGSPERAARREAAARAPPEMSEPATHTEIEHCDVEVNGVRLHCAVAGEGPLVILLHGFPDFWYGWRHQLPALAAAGFRAVAPDTRGCGRSERPPRTLDYRPRVLAGAPPGPRRRFGATPP